MPDSTAAATAPPPAPTRLRSCPRCNGRGQYPVPAAVFEGLPHVLVPCARECDVCEGAGTVHAE